MRRICSRLPLAAFTAAALVGVSVFASAHADALYVLTGVEDSAIVLDETAEAPDFSSRMVYLSNHSSGHEMNLQAGQSVTIRHGESVQTVQSKQETLSQLLKRLGAQPGPLEMVSVDLADSGITVTVDSEVTYYDKVSKEAAFETIRVANPKMAKGTEKITQAGSNGTHTSVYEVVWSNGAELSRQLVEEYDEGVVNQIVEYGTAAKKVTASDRLSGVSKNADGSGTLTFSSGAAVAFSSVKSMTATAYTSGHGGVSTRTASGTTVHVGTVAVDKNVIPLGTKLYIVTSDGSVVYGMAVAEDTGVRGNRVDLYYDTYQQCINFGRRSCTVYLLK